MKLRFSVKISVVNELSFFRFFSMKLRFSVKITFSVKISVFNKINFFRFFSEELSFCNKHSSFPLFLAKLCFFYNTFSFIYQNFKVLKICMMSSHAAHCAFLRKQKITLYFKHEIFRQWNPISEVDRILGVLGFTKNVCAWLWQKSHFLTLWKSLFQTVFVKKLHNYCMHNQTNNIFLVEAGSMSC